MNVNYFDVGFPYILIENTYNNEDLNLIWEELNFLCYVNKLKKPEHTGSAFQFDENKNKILLKRNKALLLEEVYKNREISNILTVNRKLLTNLIKIFVNSDSWFYKNCESNQDFTLISYYENEDYYEPHKDRCLITMLTWFFKEPKQFEGGDLIFDDYNTKIKIKNNHTIIFPGMISHSVEKIIMNQENINKKLGRFCMSQFLHIR